MRDVGQSTSGLETAEGVVGVPGFLAIRSAAAHDASAAEVENLSARGGDIPPANPTRCRFFVNHYDRLS